MEVSIEEFKLQPTELKKGALVLRAINHKLRQDILRLLHQNGKMKVTDLYVQMKLEQSVASQQLAILRKCRFVTTERDGKFIYYSIRYDRLQQAHDIAKRLQPDNT